ncbi:MAG TPA: hypothetical protein VGK67_02910 [Myxococcales bacterium]|jgi:hypothetical protein
MSLDSKRFSELADDGSAEARAGRMLRGAREALRGPTAQELSQVQREIEGELAVPTRWARLAPVFGLVLLVAASAAATSFGVYGLPTLREEPLVVPPQVPEALPSEAARRLPPLPEPLPEKVEAPPAVAATPTAAPRVALGKPASVEPRVEEPKPAEPDPFVGIAPPPLALPSESALGAESRVLAGALHQLRDQKDPAAALSTLDELRAQHPTGALLEEASAARIEALVALRRGDDALRELGQLTPKLPRGSVRRAQLLLLQGELLSGGGRFGEALPLFDELVAGGGATLERALFGRATARSRVGDLAGCRADLLRYLELFPQGAFAARARAELSR